MEKPILFNTDMVKAILDGKKTFTRRIIKNKYSNADIEWFENKYGRRLVYMQNDAPKDIIHEDGSRTCHLKACEDIKKPYEVGDILYVRETWCDTSKDLKDNATLEIGNCKYIFKVDDNGEDQPLVEMDIKRWRPSIHMPKEAARIFLKVKNVTAQRIQEMEHKDFISEGIREYTKDRKLFKYSANEELYKWRDMPLTAKEAFKDLWDSTIPRGQFVNLWESNPWVWVIEFEKLMNDPRRLHE